VLEHNENISNDGWRQRDYSWPKPRVASRPTKQRLTAIALRILEEALASARHGTVRRTLAHRLALAWLAHERIGLPWHYDAFWRAMAESYDYAPAEYGLRSRDLTGILNYWYQATGRQIPSHTQRAEWATQRSVSGTNRQPSDANKSANATEPTQGQTEAPEGVGSVHE